MKRNLLKGIILISAMALSSCATLNEVSKTKALGDDVYYTRAKAGVSYVEPQYIPQPEATYARNDDYYYYGDYTSLINRFSYASPFSYDDDYYYSSEPYTASSYQDTTKTVYAADDDNYDSYYDDLGVYSAYDFGYGDFDGYDDFGYGLAYSGFIYGGGTRTAHKRWYAHSNNNDGGPVFVKANPHSTHYGSQLFGRSNNSAGSGPVFTKGNTGSAIRNQPIFSGARPGSNSAVYPGRPGTNSTTNSVNVAGTNRPVRPYNQAPRPFVPQHTVDQTSSPQRSSSSSNSSSNSGGGSSGGGGSSSGGGGRPVRP